MEIKQLAQLALANLLQYKTMPGHHTFVVSVQGSWGVAQGNLLPGKTYYLKYNQGFGSVSLGVANNDDQRIAEWNSMKVVAIDESASKPASEKQIKKAQKILKRVEEGKASVNQINELHAL